MKPETIGQSATNLRFQCLQIMLQLQRNGGSLTRLLPAAQQLVAPAEQAQLQAWAFGWCRWSHQLSALVDSLLAKPLKTKDLDLYLLMQLGLFQLRHTPTASHAAVDETVKVIKRLKKPWARALVNAVLRNYQRQAVELEKSLPESALYSHPDWLLERFKTDWPAAWVAICNANNEQAPMWLRVNRLRVSAAQYSTRLQAIDINSTVAGLALADARCKAASAVLLDSPVPVSKLPGFDAGDVSVQDAAAQFAADLLLHYCPSGGRLLDACSAPGGKTAHAAESSWFSRIVAIDRDDERLSRVGLTLQRLQLSDTVDQIHADAASIDEWWDGVAFDAILLDAPCSGTGVIRRHPDIKLLRRASDIEPLVEMQKRLLEALWKTLADGGVMLYATCSVLKDENEHQLNDFLQTHANARLLDTPIQIFPGDSAMDGFFYAAIKKSAS